MHDDLATAAAAYRKADAHMERMKTESEARVRAAEEAEKALSDARNARQKAYTDFLAAAKAYLG